MRVSTLRDLIEALGGELKLVAKFRDGAVDLTLAESRSCASPAAPAENDAMSRFASSFD